jgi:hypothetical protein
MQPTLAPRGHAPSAQVSKLAPIHSNSSSILLRIEMTYFQHESDETLPTFPPLRLLRLSWSRQALSSVDPVRFHLRYLLHTYS